MEEEVVAETEAAVALEAMEVGAEAMGEAVAMEAVAMEAVEALVRLTSLMVVCSMH